MKRLSSLFILLLSSSFAFAATVDTVVTFSPTMNKKIKAVVITPDSYAAGKEYPVVYLLHGYSGNYSSWIKGAPGIADAADRHNLIVVLPDGGFSSWYYDSRHDGQMKYETYVAVELVNWVDKNYKTVKKASARAITGLSMGGHGALYLAIKHQDIFGAAGSMSGGVDIRPFPEKWDIAKRLGTYAQQPENWEKNTVINMLHLLTPGALALIIDCGTGDFFYTVNKNLHEKLVERNIPHDFISRPGVHDMKYWSNAVDYQLLYFAKFFNRK